MGEVIQFRPREEEEPPPLVCGHCGHFALSNNGIGYCLNWEESADFTSSCEEFTWPG